LRKLLIIFSVLFISAFVLSGAVSAATVKTSNLTTKISNGGTNSDLHSLATDSNQKLVSLIPLHVTSTNPAYNAGNIPTTILITVRFNSIIKNSNKQLIQLRNSSGTVIPVTYTILNNEIFIDHSPLKKYTSYTLSLKRYSIEDQAGNVLTSNFTTKFKTGSTNLLNYKAKLIIPKLGVSPNIYADSPNHYNAVYHYPNSAYFGTPGQCVLLGHRTTYSAILRYINLLNYGDTLIIKDYTSNKVSTYKVVSHEIVYNYNLISHFKLQGESDLILKSCYPVGYSYMKWVVHAVLVSTVPLGVKT
jgi:LPXTG-site transpeptidase (sortase) family protein